MWLADGVTKEETTASDAPDGALTPGSSEGEASMTDSSTEPSPLTLARLNEGVADGIAAIRAVTRLEPAGGPADKVFPPTYHEASRLCIAQIPVSGARASRHAGRPQTACAHRSRRG